MATEATLPSPDDWGPPEQPEQAEPLRYSPDPAYFGDRHFYRVVGWGLVAIVGLAPVGSIGLAASNDVGIRQCESLHNNELSEIA